MASQLYVFWLQCDMPGMEGAKEGISNRQPDKPQRPPEEPSMLMLGNKDPSGHLARFPAQCMFRHTDTDVIY